MEIIGVDFTSTPRRAKPITVAHGHASGDALTIERIAEHADWAVQRPRYGMPRNIDPVEGWTAAAPYEKEGK